MYLKLSVSEMIGMEKFNGIVSLYNEINKIYYELLTLESNGKVKSSVFSKLVDLLKEKLDEEKKLYASLIEYYKGNYDEMFALIVTCEYPEHIEKRIKDYLSICHIFNINPKESLNGQALTENEAMRRLDQLYVSCSRNLYLVYLSFLEDFVNSSAFISIKDKLLSFKYYNSFVDHDMESQLINSNFNISKVNYVDLNAVATVLKIDSVSCNEVRWMVLSDAINTSVMELLSIKDSDYMDDFKKAKAMNVECMLRAALALFGDDKLGYDFEISSINHMISNGMEFDNGLSINIIKSIVGNKDKDRTRVRKIFIQPLGK